jgi:uncharacterized protein (TIGR02246 family)
MPNRFASSCLSEAAAELLNSLIDAWAHGDGAAFGRSFAMDARFVAFDGTILHGPDEIGRYHQRAFDTHLAGTRLRLHKREVRELSDSVAMVSAQGGILRDGARQGTLIGTSVQTFVVREVGGVAQIEASQNTRCRPISGPREAQVWRDFDQAWTSIA